MNIKWFVLVFSLFFLPVFLVKAKLGLVLVHGTGHYTKESVVTVNWTKEFIDAFERPGRPLLVTHCNFDTYMYNDEASGCLARQIVHFTRKYNLTKVDIITHSFGGVVTRYVMSQPHRSKNFKIMLEKINRVITLAPSNKGTILADKALTGSWIQQELAKHFHYTTKGVRQQTTWSMEYANRVLLKGTPGRPALPKDYKYVYGSSVTANPFAGWAASCGGYESSLALSLLSWELPYCSDGFLSCESQSYAGKKLFKDTEMTEGKHYLNHNQSRRNCFGLPKILNAELMRRG